MKTLVPFLALLVLALGSTFASAKTDAILNVSYDPTRELYLEYNKAFATYWKKQSGDDVKVQQSHGGSAKQARAVIDGLGADVVTLSTAQDLDSISRISHLIDPKWQAAFPDNSTPYTSTIVLLVRKGNPKGIKDWDDLARPGIEVITPNPKTGGGSRWNYLAVYGYELAVTNGDKAKARDFVKAVYGNVKILDSGARGSTITFVNRGQGDVLIAWENEALLTVKQQPGAFEIVYPSRSILAEPSVAVVDKNVDKHGTRDVATAYLKYLYSPEGQEIIAHNYYRPRDPALLAKYAHQFPPIPLLTIQDFGGWDKAQAEHFANGALFDQIYAKK